MARVTALEKEQVSKETQHVLTEIESSFGRVPNLFKAYSHFPPLLKANWEKVKPVMVEGALSRKVKESIAVLVSKDNGCAYCVAAHTPALESMSVTEAEIQSFEAASGIRFGRD